jgi:hypothetical protein
MKATTPVILNAVKDPDSLRPRTCHWILRFAQNDTLRRVCPGTGSLILILGLLFSVLCPPVRAAAPVELASDLAYLRVHSAVVERETITAALAQPRALVLDLRYPQDERGADETLRQALTGRPAGSRLYVLVSPATPVPVVGVVAANPARLVTLGVKGAKPEPKVVIMQTAEDDRRAYDAHTVGTPLADLISGKMDKERFDEASLVHEFKNGNPDPKPPETGPANTPGASARLTDRVLQRALHLHRALQALKR